MDYSLVSDTGNLIDPFTNELEARMALQLIVAAEPEATEDIAPFSDDEGALVQGPIHAVQVTAG